ncbi:MAG TPA: HAD-IA family hydrolase, partial [Candidatus Limnocylindrales bacterium]|nr:HAD-IA family hydrolase [Candidatus Limnocylindrales bacterium]
ATMQGRESPEVAGAYDRSQDVLVERFWGRHRDLSTLEQVRVVLDCLGPGTADQVSADAMEDLVAGYANPVLAHPPALQPGAAETVRALAARGVTLGIISNTGRTPGVMLRRILESHDLLRHFSVISYSDEVGYRKPDAEIFHRTLKGAGATPGEAVHVGDNPLDDVTGARSVGMLGVHYATAGRAPAAHADFVITRLTDIGTLPIF